MRHSLEGPKKTPLFTEQKPTYREASSQGTGGGIEGLYSREAIEDILSGTKGLKQRLGWVTVFNIDIGMTIDIHCFSIRKCE